MTLRDRAALALDTTHLTMRGVHAEKMRSYVASWLDGKKLTTSFVRKAVDYLEMIAR